MECYIIQGFHINNRTHTALFYTHDLEQAVKFFNDYIFYDKDDIASINLCASCCESTHDYSYCHFGCFTNCEMNELYDVRTRINNEE